MVADTTHQEPTYDTRLSLDDQVLTELGKLVVLFSIVEHTLDCILRGFITITGRGFRPQIASIMVAELSFKQKVGQIDSIYRLSADLARDNPTVPAVANCATPFSKQLEQWTATRKLLNAAEETRNTWLHSTWIPSGTQGEIAIIQNATATQPAGSATFGFRITEDEPRSETQLTGDATRLKTTAKQGSGLRDKSAPISIAEMKSVNVRMSYLLAVTQLFSHYQNPTDVDSLSEHIDEWIGYAAE